jgi:glycyl-tRNA synthetase
MNCTELQKHIAHFKITAPDSGNEISEPFPFNMMFQTQIGPTGKLIGYTSSFC